MLNKALSQLKKSLRLRVKFTLKLSKKVENSSSQYTQTNFKLIGAPSQFKEGAWYMIEFQPILVSAEWGTAHLKLLNDECLQEISFKFSNTQIAKRFFRVSLKPEAVEISIESNCSAPKINTIEIFQVTQKLANDRAIKKIIKSNPDYSGLTPVKALAELQQNALSNKLLPQKLIHDLYSAIIFPPSYFRENNLKSFLGLGLPLPTGEFYGKSDNKKGTNKIAVTLHVYYTEMLNSIDKYLNNIPFPYTLLITTDTKEKKGIIVGFFKEHKQLMRIRSEVMLTENRGRNIAPLLIGLGKEVLQYSHMLHIHTKKSPYGVQTNGWFEHCMDHLLHSPIYISSIIDMMEHGVGFIYPPPPTSISEHLHWETMKPQAEEFLEKIEVPSDILSKFPLEFPAGAMFWCKPEAIAPLLSSQLTYNDFPKESQQRNSTLAHTIERLFLYISTHEGHSFKAVRPASKHSYFRPLLSTPGSIVQTHTVKEKPKYSILIPAFNNWELTRQCISSVIEHTNITTTPYEVILADDNSTDDTKFANRYFSEVNHIRSQKNVGFLENCNNSAKQVKGEYIFFLNNDTQVQPGWLDAIEKVFVNHQDAGIVGSKLIYPNGTLQEAGGVIWSDASGLNYGSKDRPDLPQYSYVKHSDYISGAAICIKTNLWKIIGGFDSQFKPAYYEDTDLCFTTRKLGHQVYFQPASLVVHNEGGTHGTDINNGIKHYQIRNRELFLAKWRRTLQDEHTTGDYLLTARERSSEKQVFAVIDHFLPEHDRHAGAQHTLSYIKLLLSKGYIVKYFACYINHERQLEFASYLEQLGVETFYPHIYHFEHNWGKYISKNCEYITAVIINRPHIFKNHIQACKSVGLPVLYMCHDLHNLRAYREAVAAKDKALATRIKKQEWEEIEIFKESDFSYTPSLYEEKYLKEKYSILNITYTPLYISLNSSLIQRKQKPPRKHVIFVGGMNHAPNMNAVKWFINDIWPLVLQEHPDAKFRVIGANPPDELLKAQSNSIIFLGGVSESQLNIEYANSSVAVAPLQYGAGVKGKTLEALKTGLPITLTSIASEGIPQIERIIQDKNTHLAFAKEVIRILSLDERNWLKLSHSQQLFFKDTFSESNAWEYFKKGLEKTGIVR